MAGRRAEPRRKLNRVLDESWWNGPADLSRFDGMTEHETLQALYAEWQVLKAKILADIVADDSVND